MALSQTIPISSGLSDLSLCFLTCYFVFEFVIVFSDLLFCFRICHCVFWLVIMFSGLLLCFLNCYFVFYICICVCNLLFCFLNGDLFCTYRPPYRLPWKHSDCCWTWYFSLITTARVVIAWTCFVSCCRGAILIRDKVWGQAPGLPALLKRHVHTKRSSL